MKGTEIKTKRFKILCLSASSPSPSVNSLSFLYGKIAFIERNNSERQAQKFLALYLVSDRFDAGAFGGRSDRRSGFLLSE
jgi:hypothetical protein